MLDRADRVGSPPPIVLHRPIRFVSTHIERISIRPKDEKTRDEAARIGRLVSRSVYISPDPDPDGFESGGTGMVTAAR